MELRVDEVVAKRWRLEVIRSRRVKVSKVGKAEVCERKEK